MVPIAGPILGDIVPTKEIVGGALLDAPLRLAGHDREQEFAADRTGQELAARAGYDPTACADLVIAAAQQAKMSDEEPERPGAAWSSAHPPSVEPILALREGGMRLKAANTESTASGGSPHPVP